MSCEEIENLMQQTLSPIPEEIRRSFENIVFIVEERPGEDMEPDLLGCYEGTPATEWESSFCVYPHRIILFRENIEREAVECGIDVARVVRETLLHEVGHYLGMSEDQIEAFERKWAQPDDATTHAENGVDGSTSKDLNNNAS